MIFFWAVSNMTCFSWGVAIFVSGMKATVITQIHLSRILLIPNALVVLEYDLTCVFENLCPDLSRTPGRFHVPFCRAFLTVPSSPTETLLLLLFLIG